MSAIRGDMLREPRLSQEYGFVGIASQLVTYDPQYDGIFRICWAAPWWWRIWTAA